LFSLLMLILFASISYYARSCGFEVIVFLNDRLAAINMLNMYKKKTVPIRFSGNSSSNYWNSRKKSLFLHFKQEKLWEQLNG
ncbi:hypothetical protein, partial [Bacteroides uniformis]|uniref:hypothetical protein n=1 Tax=Bacteroides uniformis TaxID=820 RepID=UPI00248050F3